MPLHTYGVLKGQVIDRRHALGGRNRHYQIQVKERLQHCRVSVNVVSQEYPSELEAAIVEGFRHPITGLLETLPLGFTVAPRRPGGLALDYIRANPVRPEDFRVIPANKVGPNNDLNEFLDELVERCASAAGGMLYAFGEPWGPVPGQYDPVFHFTPEAGLHNVHMNQGNVGMFSGDDGVWQDGGLIFQFGNGEADWTAVFLKFQSQSWHTHDSTGHHRPGREAARYRKGKRETTALGDQHPPVRIFSAIVNGPGQPEREVVALRNTTAQPLTLKGWQLADWEKNLMRLPELVFKPGEILEIPLSLPFALSNRGGIITLLDGRGWKVDGVAYTRRDAAEEGQTIMF